MRVRIFLGIVILITGIAVAAGIVRRASADAAPVITDVTVSAVTATSTTITWTTNVKTDSFVNFSQDTNYCGVRNASVASTEHSVVIPNLISGTTYFFRINSTDPSGNQSFSGNYTFATTGTAPSVQPWKPVMSNSTRSFPCFRTSRSNSGTKCS